MWLRQPLTERSPDQLMAEAMNYRCMEISAATPETREALLRLAIRLVALATRRKLEPTRRDNC
jgi:hypothetical protein